MTQLLTPETFEFFARYLLAGYIVIIIRSRFATAERPKPAELVVEAVIFSLVAQAIYQVLIWPLPVPALEALAGRAGFFVEVLVVPVILGTLFGLNVARGWNDAIFRRLSMPLSEPTRRAYDFAFLQITEIRDLSSSPTPTARRSPAILGSIRLRPMTPRIVISFSNAYISLVTTVSGASRNRSAAHYYH